MQSARPMPIRSPIKRRLIVLGALSAAGGILFLPFLAAGGEQTIAQLAGFALVVTIVSTIVAWPGLRCADAVGLPMPYMRRLDGITSDPPSPRAFGTTVTLGVVLGVLGVAALRLTGAPRLPGGVIARALSTVFAAGPLEIV